MITFVCQLCDRSVEAITRHHLTPRSRGGKDGPIAAICQDCHKQIHAMFTNKELAASLNSIDLLRENEKVKSYLSWIRKQDPSTSFRVRQSKSSR